MNEVALPEAAADKLFEVGALHNWWGPRGKRSWREYDPIGEEEFLDVAAVVIKATRRKNRFSQRPT
jgi:hypothetical protein